jgi:hypothetical protein
VLVSLTYSFDSSTIVIEIYWLVINIFGRIKATKSVAKSK